MSRESGHLGNEHLRPHPDSWVQRQEAEGRQDPPQDFEEPAQRSLQKTPQGTTGIG